MTLNLATPREAESYIARMFASGEPCSIEVREDKAFADGAWLSLGTLSLFASGSTQEKLEKAVSRGSFEWRLPMSDEVKSDLKKLLGLTDDKKHEPKLRRAIDAMAAIAVRAGLLHPRFDPHALEGLPFRRSMTVVADTSGAIQGGLDFVARHLHPAARVKVPGIVQMEIVNFADRFLSGRRAAKTRAPDLLIDHLMSQGGQRVLLRLELQGETEIERTFLLGDPLRSAFQADADPDLSQLNLSVAVRGYADRLILESARQHRAQANHGHQVQLLTSDQGLARMAMAEGITPLFFSSVLGGDLFGRRLTGATLNPFTGNLDEQSLASIMWEIATAFGSARLVGADPSQCLTIAAIGEGLSWSPYQSHADLLWCDQSRVPAWPPTPDKASTLAVDAVADRKLATEADPIGAGKGELRDPVEPASRRLAKPKKKTVKAAVRLDAEERKPSTSIPRINVGTALKLIDELDNRQQIAADEAVKLANVRNASSLEDYRRFLANAGLIDLEGGSWRANAATQKMAIALRHDDIPSVRELLSMSPSYIALRASLREAPIGQVWDAKEYARALTTTRTLAEVTHLAMGIAGDGIYPTPYDPDAAGFAPVALARFEDLNRGEGLVAVGAWLESLVREDGIHPEIARMRLAEASAAGLLRRSTEGSTTDTRFDNHTFQALRVTDGRPVVATIHLYRGDYLIPGKSSTSLRIEGQSA